MPKTAGVKLTIEELLSALKKHQSRLPKLKRQEKKLLKQLAAVQAEIAALGGSGGKVSASVASAAKADRKAGPRKRAKNKVKLADAIIGVLSKDATMSVPQIAKAVQAAGYVSKSKTFETIIYQTLARDKRVKKASRGQYQLKA